MVLAKISVAREVVEHSPWDPLKRIGSGQYSAQASAPMLKIKLDVFVAEVGFNVAELFTKLNTIAMYFAHVFFACTMVFAM